MTHGHDSSGVFHHIPDTPFFPNYRGSWHASDAAITAFNKMLYQCNALKSKLNALGMELGDVILKIEHGGPVYMS